MTREKDLHPGKAANSSPFSFNRPRQDGLGLISSTSPGLFMEQLLSSIIFGRFDLELIGVDSPNPEATALVAMV